MSKEVTCPPCGEVMRGSSDDELVTKVQSHAKVEHGHDLTRDEVLASAREA
jgi:predicted small metal-binding protein